MKIIEKLQNRCFWMGVGKAFGLFPRTDYSALIPTEQELFEESTKDVGRTLAEAYDMLSLEYGYDKRHDDLRENPIAPEKDLSKIDHPPSL